MSEWPELKENVDLEMDVRRWVLEMHSKIGTLTHYGLLQVNRGATKKEIKQAYFRLVNVVHPDKYFGKSLGTYKPKMETLFAKLSLAYETLSVPETRAEYDRELDGSTKPPVEQKATAPMPADPRAIAQRQAAMEELKARFMNAKAGAKANAKRHADAAVRARAAGDFGGAAEAYKQALALTPDDRELAEAYAEMTRAARDRLVDALVKQAQLEERYGHWAEAAATWRRVVESRPDDASARAHLATAEAHARGG